MQPTPDSQEVALAARYGVTSVASGDGWIAAIFVGFDFKQYRRLVAVYTMEQPRIVFVNLKDIELRIDPLTSSCYLANTKIMQDSGHGCIGWTRISTTPEKIG